MRNNRTSSLSERFLDFVTAIVNWMWDTCELVFDILVEFLARACELAIALLHLSFQVVCFLRDVCIEAMQTFVNVFRGFVNVVSGIECEDVEDFAAACMVVVLWIGAVKLLLGLLEKRQTPFPNPLRLLIAASNVCPAVPPRASRSILKEPTTTTTKTNNRQRVTIQTRRRLARKRPAKSTVSSSSSASCD